MKHFSMIAMILISVMILTSCDDGSIPPKRNYDYHDPVTNEGYVSYEQYCDKKYQDLIPPIILLAKHESMGGWGTTLLDSKGTTLTMGDLSILSDNIGSSFNVSDTIQK